MILNKVRQQKNPPILKVSHNLNFGIIRLKVGTPRVLVYHPFIHMSKVFQFKENLVFGMLNIHSQVIKV
jgi:hypothetical protein